MFDSMEVKIAGSDDEIRRCYPVMRQLRPQLERDEFVERVKSQQEAGYRLAYCEVSSGPACVAGFRIGENLAWGRFLYVDDFVTSETERSRGLGRVMLTWLRAYARSNGCVQLHLDSGQQRKRAHQFYQREGMAANSYHFVSVLE
jgi:GNAT superfamily N-acetyltransferase